MCQLFCINMNIVFNKVRIFAGKINKIEPDGTT